MPDTTIDSTLTERNARYGDFTEHAQTSDLLIRVVEVHPNWVNLDAVKRQALRVILDKVGRMMNGDPNYKDNWHDIQGYAKLAEDRCTE